MATQQGLRRHLLRLLRQWPAGAPGSSRYGAVLESHLVAGTGDRFRDRSTLTTARASPMPALIWLPPGGCQGAAEAGAELQAAIAGPSELLYWHSRVVIARFSLTATKRSGLNSSLTGVA